MTSRERKLRDDQIASAMAELVMNEHFRLFIDMIRQQKENAVGDSCTDAVIASQRLSMAAIGEIRCYTSIIEKYDEMLEAAQDLRDRQSDQAQ
jgi:hypothetical protein